MWRLRWTRHNHTQRGTPHGRTASNCVANFLSNKLKHRSFTLPSGCCLSPWPAPPSNPPKQNPCDIPLFTLRVVTVQNTVTVCNGAFSWPTVCGHTCCPLPCKICGCKSLDTTDCGRCFGCWGLHGPCICAEAKLLWCLLLTGHCCSCDLPLYGTGTSAPQIADIMPAHPLQVKTRLEKNSAPLVP